MHRAWPEASPAYMQGCVNTAVAVTPEQTVIETEPYHLIRHPSLCWLSARTAQIRVVSNTRARAVRLYAAGLRRAYLCGRVPSQEPTGRHYHESMRRVKRLITFVL